MGREWDRDQRTFRDAEPTMSAHREKDVRLERRAHLATLIGRVYGGVLVFYRLQQWVELEDPYRSRGGGARRRDPWKKRGG